jgi:hypothetical protein
MSEITPKDAEIEQLKAVIEDLSDHGCAAERMERLKAQSAEIEQLTAERDKWRYECQIAYAAFQKSNLKKFYEERQQEDITEHNRLMHEIAVLKALLARAVEALEESWRSPELGLPVRGPIGKLIAELRKEAK